MKKVPTLVLYWADTRKPLTYREMKSLEFEALTVSATPLELLLELKLKDMKEPRKIVVVGVTDPRAPSLPAPKKR